MTMQCSMKKGDESLVDVENVLSSPHWPPFCYSFVSSVSVLLFSQSVQLTSPSSLVCSLFCPVGVIRLNIATTSARARIKICVVAV